MMGALEILVDDAAATGGGAEKWKERWRKETDEKD